ncbi:MAG: ABC transporter ATP-binding protein [Chloroflexi bacterium]|nr:ABC transporter ATP-binding protein [Chloroflexota bacterium]
MSEHAVMAIEARCLTKHYGKAVGVQDLSLEVKPGEIFGFLGPNGAGKTTTIRLLMGLIRPTRGSARIFGLDCQREAVAVKRMVGNLPGELSLYGGLTGNQLLVHLDGVRGNRSLSYARGLAERLSIELDRPIRTLSHGSKQKIGLIQALMHRPPLVILDEPTTGLDPLVQQEVYSILDEVREDGRTVFFSSHILPEVERLCDRVAIIGRGQLLVVENIEDLRQRSTRRMEVTFAEPVPPQVLELPDVSALEWSGKTARFVLRSNVDAVIKAISHYPVADLRVWEKTLEDVFLSYYEEVGDAPADDSRQVAAR